jgi:hypothetical protein
MLLLVSDRQKVSVNQIVNVALRRYTEWEILADMIGMIDIHDKTVARLFESITEEKARELGRDSGVNAWTEMVAFMFKTVNYDTIIKTLEIRSRYGHWFIFDHTQDKDTDIIILKHQQGAKVTAFLAEALKCLLLRTGVRVEIVESEEQLVARVHLTQKTVSPEPWPTLKPQGAGAAISNRRPALPSLDTK